MDTTHKIEIADVEAYLNSTPKQFEFKRVDDCTLIVKSPNHLYSMSDPQAIIIADTPIKNAQVYFDDPPKEKFRKYIVKQKGVVKANFNPEKNTLKIYHKIIEIDFPTFEAEMNKNMNIKESPFKNVAIEYIHVLPGQTVCEKCGQPIKALSEEDEDSSWCQCPKCGHMWGHSIKQAFG